MKGRPKAPTLLLSVLSGAPGSCPLPSGRSCRDGSLETQLIQMSPVGHLDHKSDAAESGLGGQGWPPRCPAAVHCLVFGLTCCVDAPAIPGRLNKGLGQGSGGKILGWLKVHLEFSCKMLQKNPYKLFGQLHS